LPAPTPGLTLPDTLRLGLFQGCLGALAVVFAGMFNGVMISELAFPGLLVGGALAFEQFVAPSRVLFGQISDSHPFAGRRRVPYVLAGTGLFCSLAVLSVPLIFQVGRLLQDGNAPDRLDLPLDGVAPTHTRTLQFAEPALQRVRRTLPLPELAGRLSCGQPAHPSHDQ
jgi:hypothetical protein